jgi:hypothetical protein
MNTGPLKRSGGHPTEGRDSDSRMSLFSCESHAESQRFQVDTAAVDGIQLVTVLFQVGREDIVYIARDTDGRSYHGKQGAHPFVVITTDIGLSAFPHNVVVKQMFGILLQAVPFPACFLPKDRGRYFFTSRYTGIFHLVGYGRNPGLFFRI